eukprot:EG_transcript_14673
MDVDTDGQERFYARVKQAQSQRRMNADYAVVDRQQENTLLLREVDDMKEDDILNIFAPKLKDEVVSIRLFPPIPGTRGFAFIEFKDPIVAIRAFTVKHRGTFMYRGTPKKINLSRPTKGKPEEEWKWDKVLEQRAGKADFDNTPRRINFTKGTVTSSTPITAPGGGEAASQVQTVPFSEVLKAVNSQDKKEDRPADAADAADADSRKRSREEEPPRDRLTSESRASARGGSPSRRRSPPRISPPRRRSPPRDSRRPSDDPFRAPRDRYRSPPRDDRRGSSSRDFGDRRSERRDDRDPRRDSFDDRRSDRRDPFDERRGRDDDLDDRKRRR